MKKYPKISIIIPLYVIVPRFFDDLKKFSKLDYPDFEILVVCDKKVNLGVKKVRLVLTGRERTGPAEKRDIALKLAEGEICAFIDDDAYPHPMWLKNALKNFQDKRIAAVGGPGVTPVEDSYWERLTGHVYSSFFCGGLAQYRFVKGSPRFVEDYPAYNLLIRTKILKKVGGYGSSFYGGEDTFLCLKLIKEGYQIFYDPEVVVFHHRRPLYTSYLQQIGNVGRHRGYFARVFPQTSFRILYFFPSFVTFGLILFFLMSIFLVDFWKIGLASLTLIFVLIYATSMRQAGVLGAAHVAIAILLTHITYGVEFVKGFFTPKIER
jgi:GT2 family glycosyltransferase